MEYHTTGLPYILLAGLTGIEEIKCIKNAIGSYYSNSLFKNLRLSCLSCRFLVTTHCIAY